jgi:hypothetical protein
MAGIHPLRLVRDFSVISFLVTRATKIIQFQFPIVPRSTTIDMNAIGSSTIITTSRGLDADILSVKLMQISYDWPS